MLARKPLEKLGGNQITVADNVMKHGTGGINIDECRIETDDIRSGRTVNAGTESAGFLGQVHEAGEEKRVYTGGRWPANVLHDGLEEDWSRYFYCAKVSKKERNRGLDGFEAKMKRQMHNGEEGGTSELAKRWTSLAQNNHPTVKPIKLMAYLARLITPKGGTVLDPFTGSGSTGVACMIEGFNFIGVEMDADYATIAQARIKHALDNPEEWK